MFYCCLHSCSPVRGAIGSIKPSRKLQWLLEACLLVVLTYMSEIHVIRGPKYIPGMELKDVAPR